MSSDKSTDHDHDHNGLYTRRAECELVRDGFFREIGNVKEDVIEVKSSFNKILWLIVAGFVANLGGTVIIRLVIG